MQFTSKTRGCLKRDISLLLTSMGGRFYGGFYQNQNFFDAKVTYFLPMVLCCADLTRESSAITFTKLLKIPLGEVSDHRSL